MENSILSWGLEVIEAFQGGLPHFMVGVFHAITFLGNEEFFLVLIPLYWWSQSPRSGRNLAWMVILSTLLNLLLKESFAQPRPEHWEPHLAMFHAGGFGLPSGHAQTAAALWPWLLRDRKNGVWLGAFIAFCVGISRVYLGVHFPSDVLCGWFVGGIFFWIFRKYSSRLVGFPSLCVFVVVSGAFPLLMGVSLRTFLMLAGALLGMESGWRILCRLHREGRTGFREATLSLVGTLLGFFAIRSLEIQSPWILSLAYFGLMLWMGLGPGLICQKKTHPKESR